MTKKELVWRLQEKPSGDIIERLVERGIITKEEARQILFSEKDLTYKMAKTGPNPFE